MTEADDVKKRLDVLIRLLLEQQIQDKKSTRNDQIDLMNSVGLEPKDIAKIIGYSPGDVSSQINKIKKKKQPKKRKSE
jgi:DNA-binding MarR family transcriptional regulator